MALHPRPLWVFEAILWRLLNICKLLPGSAAICSGLRPIEQHRPGKTLCPFSSAMLYCI